jgi:hypothetical protein
MIRCPTCGTYNKDSRKACSNCGTTLPQTQIRCPNCGTLNPLGNVLCDHCNGRLVDADDMIPAGLLDEPEDTHQGSQVRGISLPTRAASEEGEEDVAEDDGMPDWLRSLAPDPDIYEEEDVATPDAAEDTGTDEGYPDWLSDLLGDEMEQEGASQEGASQEGAPQEGAPQEGGSEEGAPQEEAAQERASQREGLQEEAEEAIGDLEEEADALPSWFTEAAGGYEDEDADDVYEAETGNADSTEFDSALPDWLTAFADSSEPEHAPSTEAAPPDWLLTDVAETDVDPYAYAHELPDWLLDMEDEDKAKADAEAEPWDDEPAPLLFAESELPDWLKEVETSPDPASDSESVFESGSAPRQQAAPEQQAAPFETEDEDLASPLASTETEGDDDAAPSAFLDEGTAGDETTSGEEDAELPDWLIAFADAPEPESEVAEPESAPPAEAPPAPITTGVESDDAEQDEEPEATTTEPEDMALPDWLTDIDIDTDKDAAGEEGSAVFEEAMLLASQIPEDERPPWLEKITEPGDRIGDQQGTPAFLAEEEAEAPTVAQPEEVEEETDWVQDLDLADTESPTTIHPEPEDDRLPRADLPGWLQALAPEDLTIGRSRVDVFEDTEDLVSADIPDWIRAFQPSAEREGARPTQASPFLPTPAEPEGPLEGLRGVLQPLITVDIPSGVQPVAEMPIPDAVAAQAQLWRQLLEQPRMAERPVSQEAQRTKTGKTVMRLLVTAVLILGCLAAFWMLPADIQLSQMGGPGATGATGAEAMIAALDRLQSGDEVILAVEYGNAHAAELAEVIAPVLTHLDAQGAMFEIVSTLPEGVALGAGLVQQTADSDVTGASTANYLPGNASGISSYLMRPTIANKQHLLIVSSSPERVRWWLEQTALANETRDMPLAVSVGLSASAGPHIAPYLQTVSVEGWLVGMPDALTYRGLRSQGDSSSLARLAEYGRVQDVLMLAHWAAGVFLLFGLFIGLVGGKKGKR